MKKRIKKTPEATMAVLSTRGHERRMAAAEAAAATANLRNDGGVELLAVR